jgi:hypothetical protein
MDSLNQRQKDFEAKYLHDKELEFRVCVKRNHLFGVWAGTLLGYTNQKAQVYIEEVVMVDIQKKHEDDVLHKVLRDLECAKIEMSEHRLRKELERCWIEAHKIMMNKEES